MYLEDDTMVEIDSCWLRQSGASPCLEIFSAWIKLPHAYHSRFLLFFHSVTNAYNFTESRTLQGWSFWLSAAFSFPVAQDRHLLSFPVLLYYFEGWGWFSGLSSDAGLSQTSDFKGIKWSPEIHWGLQGREIQEREDASYSIKQYLLTDHFDSGSSS